MTPLSHKIIQWMMFALVRLFYPNLQIHGSENIPSQRPLIFVLNHPNGLLDPLVLMAALNRPVIFLAKSTLFGNPVGRFFMQAFGAVPVFRPQDEGKPGGPRGDTRRRNSAAFARCQTLLQQGRALALFPEGQTHSNPRLLPFHTGAARLALDAEADSGGRLGLQLVPVGLWYQNKTRFRTEVLLVVGRPIAAANFAGQEKPASKLTIALEAELRRVVLHAENAELLAAVAALAEWVAPAGRRFLPERYRWAARLLAVCQQLKPTNPARVEAMARQAQAYAEQLAAAGIHHPRLLEQPPTKRDWLARLSWLALAALPALAGWALSYGPYRLAGPLANRLVGRDDTQTGTFKLVIGAILVLLGWLVEAGAAGLFVGLGGAAALLALAPLLAYTALRWSEQWQLWRQEARAGWLRRRQPQRVAALVAMRYRLARQVVSAVQVDGALSLEVEDGLACG